MDSGQYELQIFVSLVVVLGAAFVALICDFLKGNNEQLRELAIELRVRHEEEQRREQTMIPQRMERPRPAESAAAQVPETGAIISTPREEPVPEVKTASAIGVRTAKPVLARSIVARPEAAKVPVTPSAKKDWGSLISRSAPASKLSCPAAAAGLPAGFHPAQALSDLIASRRTITGLVVSIGITARRASGSLPDAVPDLIRSLIHSGEFACQSGAEEFLLICPAEQGAAAQRRLSQIAQQLWDFQLGSLGKFSMLFSWGGLEVRHETIDEAIASAHERMNETRRSRKVFMLEPSKEMAFRQAV